MCSPSMMFKLESSVLSESVELSVSSDVKKISSQKGNSLPRVLRGEIV